jgi:hypothetical protein
VALWSGLDCSINQPHTVNVPARVADVLHAVHRKCQHRLQGWGRLAGCPCNCVPACGASVKAKQASADMHMLHVYMHACTTAGSIR